MQDGRFFINLSAACAAINSIAPLIELLIYLRENNEIG